jgi:PHP family Zn ribbon phosphoesterase
LKLVELDKIIAESLGLKSRQSVKVQAEYTRLIEIFGNEMEILTKALIYDLAKVTLPKIAEGIKRVREGNLIIEPGFDGQYGKVKIFNDKEAKDKQNSLF